MSTTNVVRVPARPNAAVRVVEQPVVGVRVVQEGLRGPAGPKTDINDLLEAVDESVQDYFVLHPQSFVYYQGTEVFHIEIVHPLDHNPVVTAVDSAGDVARGLVSYPAANRVAINFNQPFAGKFTLT